MTTFENIAYPLRVAGMANSEISLKVVSIAEKMNIAPLLHRSTTNLSGGELQRTALARTLVTSPRLLLLDEPLASIDASLKDDITRLLRSINKSGQTIIHVTHDYSEAIGLASKVGVIHNGRIIQTGTPAEVFSRPVNRFVARYTGIRNFFRTTFSTESGASRGLTDGGLDLTLTGNNYPQNGLLIIRSSNVRLSTTPEVNDNTNVYRGKIVEIVATPSGCDVEIDAGERIFASVPEGDSILSELHAGKDVFVNMASSHLVWLKGTT